MTPTIPEMKALCDKATDGPWYTSGLPWSDSETSVLAGSPDPHVSPEVSECENPLYSRDEYGGENRPFKLKRAEDDAAFIAASRTFIPAAIAEIERLRGALEIYAKDLEAIAKRTGADYDIKAAASAQQALARIREVEGEG